MKALVLFSGGLDSILAVKLLQNQNLKVTAISFSSYFFDTSQAQKSAQSLEIELITKDIAQEQLKVVKKPHYGHGAGLNPCIDCHAEMIKSAYQMMQEKGFDILATGEVLGQRPFSQNSRALKTIEKEINLEGKILRPLSARLLAPTIYEEQGLVKRDLLEDILGRSRKRQLELASAFAVQHYPSPAGGCRLTEKDFSKKLALLLEHVAQPTAQDFELIRFGRHFWPENKEAGAVHIVLGRNAEENVRLESLARSGDLVLKREDEKGPTALIRDYQNIFEEYSTNVIQQTKNLIKNYSKNNRNKGVLSYLILRFLVGAFIIFPLFF